jgi:hypothetical protein
MPIRKPAAQWKVYWLSLADELPWLGSGFRRAEACIGSKWAHVRDLRGGTKHKLKLQQWHCLKPALASDIRESGYGVGQYFAHSAGRDISPKPYRGPRTMASKPLAEASDRLPDPLNTEEVIDTGTSHTRSDSVDRKQASRSSRRVGKHDSGVSAVPATISIDRLFAKAISATPARAKRRKKKG